ncbi:MAG: TlpA family protein disulfide reductase [Deltaproteobacteria bacterium]|nr:TlpA family protein disulfide reductase [Deltaproteobacteria bacterium]
MFWLVAATACATAKAPVEAEPGPAVAAAPAVAPEPAAAAHVPPEPGEAAPSLAGLEFWRGEAPKAGRGYLLFFWGTWCKPCKGVIPDVLAGAQARGLPVVAVSRDRPDMLEAFFPTWTAPFPERVAIEAHPYPLHEAYGAWSIPRAVIVGADGRVETVLIGPAACSSLAHEAAPAAAATP